MNRHASTCIMFFTFARFSICFITQVSTIRDNLFIALEFSRIGLFYHGKSLFERISKLQNIFRESE